MCSTSLMIVSVRLKRGSARGPKSCEMRPPSPIKQTGNAGDGSIALPSEKSPMSGALARTPPERAVQRNLPDTDIKVLYCFYQNNGGSKCEVAHTSPSLIPNKTRQVWEPGGDTWHRNQNQLGSYLPPGWR